VLQDHDASPEPARRNLPAAHALVCRRTRDAEQCRNLGDGIGPSAVGHHFRSGRRTPTAADSARRENRPGCCSDDRCAVHGADRAQGGLLESLPRPHTRSLPPPSSGVGRLLGSLPSPAQGLPAHTRPLTRARLAASASEGRRLPRVSRDEVASPDRTVSGRGRHRVVGQIDGRHHSVEIRQPATWVDVVEMPERERRRPVRGSSTSPGEWCAGPPEPSHIITRRCTVPFRSVTGASASGRCSSVLESVSLCGSTPISAIESPGLSGRGGHRDPSPERCILGPQLGEAFSQQLELLLPASIRRALAVQFCPDPIEPAQCRLVSSTLGL
jgi:hypothetical protein